MFFDSGISRSPFNLPTPFGEFGENARARHRPVCLVFAKAAGQAALSLRSEQHRDSSALESVQSGAPSFQVHRLGSSMVDRMSDAGQLVHVVYVRSKDADSRIIMMVFLSGPKGHSLCIPRLNRLYEPCQ